MKIVVIDGQGGSLGKALVEGVKGLEGCEIYAVGTNSIATSAMLKSGADFGATGENPVVVNCRDADIIAGPIGIIAADSLLGEITEKMAAAVAKSNAAKVLIPVSRCSVTVAGVRDMPMGELIKIAVEKIKTLAHSR